MKMLCLISLILLSCSNPTSPINIPNGNSAPTNTIQTYTIYSKMLILSSYIKNDQIIDGTGIIVINPPKKIQRGDCLEILMFIEHPGNPTIVREAYSNVHWIDHAGNLRILVSLNFHPMSINKKSIIHTFLLNQ